MLSIERLEHVERGIYSLCTSKIVLFFISTSLCLV